MKSAPGDSARLNRASKLRIVAAGLVSALNYRPAVVVVKSKVHSLEEVLPSGRRIRHGTVLLESGNFLADFV